MGAGPAPQTFVPRSNVWFGWDGAPRPRLDVVETGAIHDLDPGLVNAGTREMRATSTDRRIKAAGARGYVRPGGAKPKR